MATPICTRVASVTAPRRYVDSRIQCVRILAGPGCTERVGRREEKMLHGEFEWYVERIAALSEASVDGLAAPRM